MSKELLKSIEREFVHLNYRWKILCQLYESGEKNINLLNKSGSNIFHLLQKLIIDETMLSLCRLDDPPNLGKNFNASIRGYLDKVEIDEIENVEIQKSLLELEEPMKEIRNARKKILAHSDALYATKIEVLERITYDDIEYSIALINKILNIITGCSGDYIPSIPSGHDGKKLLKLLASAHEKMY